MIRDVVKDQMLLSIKSVPADKNDLPVVIDLLDTLKANADHCVGMAANMIGVRKTILAARINGKFIVMINPVITERSKQIIQTSEGCLCLSGSRPVTRNIMIKVDYFDRKFNRKKGIYRGIEAQIIQHEIDHFNGIII